MSHLTITRQQFPSVVPADAKVGDTIAFTVTGTIRRIEADLVDVSACDGHEYMLGPVETEVALKTAVRA